MYNVGSDAIDTQVPISKTPIIALCSNATPGGPLFGITSAGEVFVCSLYLGSAIRVCRLS
ncbi:MAG: hypothetical protein P4M11_15520 [Candidatus Pacebacteria bacterium]|nr:hypothetical protein [Candidatus Paceibacterota bacterium]